MAEIELSEAARILEELVERAEAGEEIVLTRDGTPAVRLVAIATANSRAAAYGALRGRIAFAPDFDELPDDIAGEFGAR